MVAVYFWLHDHEASFMYENSLPIADQPSNAPCRDGARGIWIPLCNESGPCAQD